MCTDSFRAVIAALLNASPRIMAPVRPRLGS